MMGTLRRLARYLSQMFCLWVMVPIGFANFFAIYWTLQLLNTSSPVLMNWRSVGGACMTSRAPGRLKRRSTASTCPGSSA